ncbi:MarR family winged helix-turn-helix transcriptional regulator [Alkalicoccus saliphilus]|jgi:DNA-binding MarR family transcriptional regulator|nr:MarR family transcriptional regulator [Alkalicoccus saliphilus]
MERNTEEIVGYQLGLVAHLLQNKHNRSLAAHGLTRAQVKVLSLLQRYGTQSQSELQKRLYIQPSTMNGIVESLTKNELVEKQESGKDRRQKMIALTDKGGNLEETLWQEALTADEELTACLSEKDREMLLEILKGMKERLQEDLEE